MIPPYPNNQQRYVHGSSHKPAHWSLSRNPPKIPLIMLVGRTLRVWVYSRCSNANNSPTVSAGSAWPTTACPRGAVGARFHQTLKTQNSQVSSRFSPPFTAKTFNISPSTLVFSRTEASLSVILMKHFRIRDPRTARSLSVVATKFVWDTWELKVVCATLVGHASRTLLLWCVD